MNLAGRVSKQDYMMVLSFHLVGHPVAVQKCGRRETVSSSAKENIALHDFTFFPNSAKS